MQGVGADRRHDIERVFFQRHDGADAGAQTNVKVAALAVRVAAIDLFGLGSAAFAAVHQALDAVGLRS